MVEAWGQCASRPTSKSYTYFCWERSFSRRPIRWIIRVLSGLTSLLCRPSSKGTVERNALSFGPKINPFLPLTSKGFSLQICNDPLPLAPLNGRRLKVAPGEALTQSSPLTLICGPGSVLHGGKSTLFCGVH